MSNGAEIQALKTLAALDAELVELETALTAEREALEGKRAQLQELEDRVRLNTESIQELEKTRSQLLAELRQMSAQIDKAREKLARCRNEREANAAQRELEELRKLYRDREHEMEKLVGVASEVKGVVDAASKHREELEGELDQSQGLSSQKIAELEGATKEKQQRRAEISKGIDQVLFRRYELIRKRRGSGLAQALNGGCEACHIKLPPMMFQQISQGGPLQQCPSCNRILYFEPTVSEASDGETEIEEPAHSREQKQAGAPDTDSGETRASVDRAG